MYVQYAFSLSWITEWYPTFANQSILCGILYPYPEEPDTEVLSSFLTVDNLILESRHFYKKKTYIFLFYKLTICYYIQLKTGFPWLYLTCTQHATVWYAACSILLSDMHNAYFYHILYSDYLLIWLWDPHFPIVIKLPPKCLGIGARQIYVSKMVGTQKYHPTILN